jgi:hypothetical protein
MSKFKLRCIVCSTRHTADSKRFVGTIKQTRIDEKTGEAIQFIKGYVCRKCYIKGKKPKDDKRSWRQWFKDMLKEQQTGK